MLTRAYFVLQLVPLQFFSNDFGVRDGAGNSDGLQEDEDVRVRSKR